MSTFFTFRIDVDIYIYVIYVDIYNMNLEMSTSKKDPTFMSTCRMSTFPNLMWTVYTNVDMTTPRSVCPPQTSTSAAVCVGPRIDAARAELA